MNSQLSIINYLNIPKRCLINQKITKKTLLENAEVKASFKKIVRDDIQDMFIVASITPKTANISKFIDENFHYDEIHLIKVTLKKKTAFIKSAELLQSVIPYSLIILFEFENEYCFNIAEKRINQVDKSKKVIGDYIFTEWEEINNSRFQEFLKSISFNNLSHFNLKTFYDDIIARIFNFKASVITGSFQIKPKKDTQKDVEILRQIKHINDEIVSLKNSFKKETNFNERVNLNVKIKKLEIQKRDLKQSIIKKI